MKSNIDSPSSATVADEEPPTGRRPTPLRSLVPDFLGGLAGTAVALPQSTALGVVLFTGMGFDASMGALAGLVGAATLSLVSGIPGATTGMISAPNGPVVMLLSASMASVAASGVAGEGLLLALLTILVLMGLFQFLLGVSGGGQLIKFIPYPAVAGIVTGIGLLMILSQVTTLSGSGADTLDPIWVVFPGIIALVTFAGIKLGPRVFPKVPGIISGLLLGFGMFHLILLAAPGPEPETWVVGRLPGFDFTGFHIDFSAFDSLPWQIILVSSLTLAVLASVDCLLTAVIADEETGERHNASRELAAQGIGQVLAGMLGGVGGGGTKGSTLVAIKSGGRRWAALASGISFLILILFLGPTGQFLPISVLAGVIIYIGVEMVEWQILHWIRQPQTRLDATVALLVIVTSLVFDLMVGVAVGVLGSVLLFLRQLVNAPIIHERATGKELRSLHFRPRAEYELLQAYGERIVYIELRGNLFFGTADRLYSELLPDLDRPLFMIINMRRVQYMDISGLHLFKQMIKRLHAHGGEMIYSNVRKSAVTKRKMHKLLKWLGPERGLPKVRTFLSTDAALEYAEDSLLISLGETPVSSGKRLEAEENEIFKYMKPGTREVVLSVMRPVSLKRKQTVFNFGEPGDAIYLILEGEVELRLPTRKYHYKRLGKRGPGSYIGAVAFLNPGPRAATAFVVRDVELLMLDRDGVDSLAEKRQREAGQTVLYELGTSLARNLRLAMAELRRLERW